MTAAPPKLIMTIVATTLCGLGLGCATPSGPQPARLATTDAATMTAVRNVLATALGRTRFELGPEDMATSTIVSVLPPPLGPYDTRSSAVPVIFDIKKDATGCTLVAREGGKSYPLTGVECIVAVRP
jgi:hypothetical protein